MKLNIHIASFLVSAVILALVAADADSRSRRGGSGYSRTGVASGGSFSDRAGERSSQHTERQTDRSVLVGTFQVVCLRFGEISLERVRDHPLDLGDLQSAEHQASAIKWVDGVSRITDDKPASLGVDLGI